MARPVEWTYHLSNTLWILRSIDAPVITSSGLGAALKVSPRQATKIMQLLGATLESGRLSMRRELMIERLEKIEAGEPVQWEREKQKRLIRVIFDAQKTIRAHQTVLHPQPIPGWPSGVSVQRGSPHRLEIEYTNSVELLTRLLEIAQAAAEDMDVFQKRVEL